jgi:HEAT repeat protein
LKHFQKILERILSLTRDKSVSLEVYEVLVKEGLEELIPPWLKPEEEKKEEDLIQKVESLLKEDSLALLDKETLKKLPPLLKELDLRGKKEQIEKITDKLSENLNAATADIRLETVKYLGQFASTLLVLTDKTPLRNLDNRIFSRIKKESDPQVYQELSLLLKDSLFRLLEEDNFEKIGEIIDLFRQHRFPQESFPKRAEQAEKTLTSISQSPILRVLLNDLKSDDLKRREYAEELISKLGDTAITPLIEEIKETKDEHLRGELLGILRGLGEDATARLIEELNAEPSPLRTMRLLEIANRLKGKEDLLLEQYRKSLLHPDFHIREKVVSNLAEIGTPRAGEILMEALDDERTLIRQQAAKALGKLSFQPAVAKLTFLIRPKSIFSFKETREISLLNVAICYALGEIKDPEAIPTLLKIVLPPFLSRKKSSEVRIAALRALENFLKENIEKETIKKALQKLSKSKDRLIRKTAQEILSSY